MMIKGRGVLAGVAFCCAAVVSLAAAEFNVTADTPVSFRASFTGVDTDPASIGGNDFTVASFDFWTVLVNLRGDGVDENGDAFGFYEIQLRHTGATVEDPDAPVVNTFGFYSGLQPGVTLSESTVSSQPNGVGSEYLSTTVHITYDPGTGRVTFSGTIAGDSDLDGDAIMDSDKTDAVVDTLKGLKDVGIITGKEMGQIIKQTRQPRAN